MRPTKLCASIAGALSVLAVVTAPALAGEIAIQNLDEAGRADGALFPDRLIFNAVRSPSGSIPKTTAAVRIQNASGTPLTVTGLSVTGRYALDAPIALPAVIPGNGSLDVPVRFITTQADPARQDGTLRITSDDADEPVTVVQLAGLSQQNTGGARERTLADILDTFGYTTAVVRDGERLRFHGRVEAVGDEVLSPYWRRADTSRPVTVRQLGAFHGPGSNTTSWFAKDGPLNPSTGLPRLHTIMRHDAAEWQTILPHEENLDPAFRAGVRAFTPSVPVFGFKVSESWSDEAFNPWDTTTYCDQPPLERCGHYIRFYPAKDRGGVVIPNAYVMAMDFPLKNYDYNDNVFLVGNVAPETTAPDTTAPTVTQRTPGPGAVDVDPDGEVSVTFSEPVAPASVTATSARLLQGGSVVPSSRSLAGGGTQLVIDPTDPLAPGVASTVSLGSGITDAAGNPLAPLSWSFTTASGNSSPGPYRFSGGQAVLEAEHADDVVDRSGQAWQLTGPAGSVGGAMTALADSGRVYEAGGVATAPELRFQVEFPAAGTYRLAIRGNAPSTNSNSIHIGIDGAVTADSDAITAGAFGSWAWFAPSTGGPNPSRISVPSAGVHTVNVWPREDGISVDRIVIAPLGTATPSGDGPPESPRA